MQDKISEHITLKEASKSQYAERKGIDNTPDEVIIANMQLVAEKCFEPVRQHFGKPIGISSFYRCPSLNLAIGGVANSQHIKGQAIDIDGDIFGHVSNSEIFAWIKANLQFDQLIWEYGNDENPAWVHVSYTSGINRQQVLKLKKK
jgi:zinc D-Ala-D-Ala carboxypeptidase